MICGESSDMKFPRLAAEPPPHRRQEVYGVGIQKGGRDGERVLVTADANLLRHTRKKDEDEDGGRRAKELAKSCECKLY